MVDEAATNLDDVPIYDLEVHALEKYRTLLEYLDDDVAASERDGYKVAPKRGPFPWDGWDRSAGGRIQWEPGSIDDPSDYEDAREQFGVDTVVFSPGRFKLAGIPDREARVAYLWAANRFLVDRFADPAADNYVKLFALPEHPRESAAIVEEFSDDPGVAGVFVVDVGTQYPLGHDRHAPLLEAAERADLPLFLHGGSGQYNAFPTAGLNVGTFLEAHTLAHPITKLWHATSIVAEEIPERYDLDWCFLEAGLSWVQLLRTRLDREYLERPSDAPGLTRKPSEYLSEFFYGVQPLEEQPRSPSDLATVVEMNDLADSLVLTTDYPHMDFDSPRAVLDHPGLSDEQKRKIVHDNPRELLGL